MIQIPYGRRNAASGGGWVPTDIGGCVLWLRGDGLVTKDGSDLVSQWSDESSVGTNHALQATGSNQPLYVADGGIGLNNKPVIRFNGSDNFLVANIAASYSQPITLFMVWTENSRLEQYPFAVGTSFGGNMWLQYYSNSMLSLIPQAGGVKYYREIPISLITAGIWNGASSEIYENGHLVGSGTPNSNALTGTLNLGVAYDGGYGGYMNGDLAEIIVYDGLLSASDFILVEDYLENKYKPYISEVPIMSNATTPSGVVTVSAQNAGYEGWRVFDGKYDGVGYTSCWYYTSYPQWVGYEFSGTEVIKGYRVHGGAAVPTEELTGWSLKASNTGAFAGEETILDIQIGQDVTSMKLYTIANTTTYKYYRFTVTAGGASQFVLHTLEFDSRIP